MRWRVSLSALVALAGCASPTHFSPADLAAGNGGDGGKPRDMAGAKGDLSTGNDGASGDDMTAAAGDMAAQAMPDLSAQAMPDLTMKAMPDLSAQPMPDLAIAKDMVIPPDLTQSPDMVMVMQCVPQTQPCDVICQNCGVNLKCSANNMGAPVCVATGNVPTGQPCGQQGVDNCVAGDICIELSQMQNLTECDEFCRMDGDCKNGGKCAYTVNGGTLKICSDPVTVCDPVNKTGCQNGACFVVTPNGLTGCHAAGPGGECGGCITDYDCQAGFACFGPGNLCFNGGCLKLCHKGNNNECAFPRTCQNVVYDQNNDTWANWGVCTI